jgi:RND family efflux transporter MFP subunit
VGVAKPIVRKVVNYEDFTGQTDAKEAVDIRARVTGYLVKVSFKDGEIVKENELLYEIDPRPFQDDLDRAKGEIERLEAEKKLFEIQVARYRTLVAERAAAQQDLDEYLAKQAANVGALKSAQAQAALAALNLGFTRIAAPITGKIDRTLITPGNLVNADNTVLTNIVSIDPMYAYFDIDEPTVLRIQKMIREGVIESHNLHEIGVRMGLADDVDRRFPLRGTLDFVSNALDPQTGTMSVRGVFANPYQQPGPPPMLTPGLFVRVRLRVGPPHRTLLVNEKALGTDQGQKFVYVVDAGNKVGYRQIKLGQVFDGLQAIEEGLKPDDRVVVNGLQRVRPGMEVHADPVDMRTLAAPAQAEHPAAPVTPSAAGAPPETSTAGKR